MFCSPVRQLLSPLLSLAETFVCTPETTTDGRNAKPPSSPAYCASCIYPHRGHNPPPPPRARAPLFATAASTCLDMVVLNYNVFRFLQGDACSSPTACCFKNRKYTR